MWNQYQELMWSAVRAPRIACLWLVIVRAPQGPFTVSFSSGEIIVTLVAFVLSSPISPFPCQKHWEGINNAPGTGEQNIIRGFYFLSPVTIWLSENRINHWKTVCPPVCLWCGCLRLLSVFCRMLMRGVAGRVPSGSREPGRDVTLSHCQHTGKWLQSHLQFRSLTREGLNRVLSL